MRLITVLLCLLPAFAYAATLEVKVQHPTTNSDGSAIPATGPLALASMRIEYGSCRGSHFGKLKGWQVLPTSITTTRFTQVPLTTVCERVYWYNNAGGRSQASTVLKVRQ